MDVSTDAPDGDSRVTRTTRRSLIGAATGLVAGGALASIGRVARAASDGAPAVHVGAGSTSAPRAIVVVMLRGAVDGLSVVVPHADADYTRQRAEIAIASPGADGGALPLDGPFGLHPALAPLMPLWTAGRLAFVHASGSVDPTRSHFDAQDFMETATPGRRSTPDGWLNRLLADGATDAPARASVRGVNLGPTMPRILGGGAQVASLSTDGPQRAGSRAASPTLAAALDRAYADDAAMAAAWSALRESRVAMASAEEAMVPGMDPGIAAGSVPIAGLARDAARLGRLLRREPTMSAASFSVGGWDTHVNQGGAQGQLAGRLGALASGLDALVRALDDRLDDTLIVVMSEFGRTVRQNGTRGTDHGHGNAMWLIGGGVRGARVHGRWPGLDAAALHEGRDLAVTTDFRQVIAQALGRHLRLDDRALARVLPDGAGEPAPLDVIRG